MLRKGNLTSGAADMKNHGLLMSMKASSPEGEDRSLLAVARTLSVNSSRGFEDEDKPLLAVARSLSVNSSLALIGCEEGDQGFNSGYELYEDSTKV